MSQKGSGLRKQSRYPGMNLPFALEDMSTIPVGAVMQLPRNRKQFSVTVATQVPVTLVPMDASVHLSDVEEACLVVTDREEDPELPALFASPPYVAKMVTVE